MAELEDQQLVTSAPLADVPSVAEQLSELDEFIAGVHEYRKSFLGLELESDIEVPLRSILSQWNNYLRGHKRVQAIGAIISPAIDEDMNKYFQFLSNGNGEQLSLPIKQVLSSWLPRWNKFLQALAGATLVTWWDVSLTAVGLCFYLLDQVSDFTMSLYYACSGQWWRALFTLLLVYLSVIVNTGWKCITTEIHTISSVGRLRCLGALLINWPDLKQYGALCHVEWQLHQAPQRNARLVPEWLVRRFCVAFLKFTEGACEACPQAILQLYFLLPDLYGDWTWTIYLRLVSASISLCSAGAALVNLEKWRRLTLIMDVRELIVLHLWMAPVTVSRLLSVALLMTVYSYWCLAGVVLHLVLYGVYWYRSYGLPRVLNDVFAVCVGSLQFFISPFVVDNSITVHRQLHAVHLLTNTVATVVWALGTPLVCAQPALCTAIICFNAAMFAVGLVGLEVHKKYWHPSTVAITL